MNSNEYIINEISSLRDLNYTMQKNCNDTEKSVKIDRHEVDTLNVKKTEDINS